MNFFLRHKKITQLFAILVTTCFVLLIFAYTSLAAPVPATSPAGKGAAAPGILSNTSSVLSASLVVFAGLYTLRALLSLLVTFLGNLLDKIFVLNIGWTPLGMPAVVTGWTIMRDIANSLFILVVLWIAFTIIFGKEEWGGKKLLVRVILIALLINFSLPLVSAVFSFSNALAEPFAAKIKDGKVGSVIIANTKIQTVAAEISEAELRRVTAQEEAAQRAAQEAQNTNQQVPYYLGVQDANAVAPIVAGIGLCALGALTGIAWTGIGAVCGLGTTALSWATGFFATPGTTLISGALQYLVNMALGSVILLVAAFALATACIVLMARIVAMSFLTVLAPAAFLAFILPGRTGQKYWNMWVENLIKWSFYAPAFYFLFYLALLMLQKMSASLKSESAFDMERLFVLAMFFGFLIGATILARKMGITVADSFVNWGKKMGLGALTGAGGLIASTAGDFARRWGGAAAQKIESSEAYQKAAPYVPFSGVARRGLQKAAAAERGAVGKTEGDFDKFTSAELQRRYADTFTTGTERAAIMKVLSKRGDIPAEPGVIGWGEEQIRQGIGHIRRTGGDVMPLLRAAPEQVNAELLKRYPDLIPENSIKDKIRAAQREGRVINELEALREIVIEKAKSDDVAKWSKESLRNNPENVKAMWRYMTPNRIERLMRDNTAVGNQLMDELRRNPNLDTTPQTYTYLASNQARALGLTLPPNLKVPTEVEKEDTKRYEETVERGVEKVQEMYERLKLLRKHAHDLRTAGDTKEADKTDREADRLEKIEIPLTGKKIQP